MISTNEKTGPGCRPFRSQTRYQTAKFDTNRIGRKPFEIKGQRARPWLKITAGQRFNELGRLVAYRREYGLAMGPASGWAIVLANLSECLGVTSDCQTVDELRRRLRLPALDPDVVAPACKPADGKLLNQAYVGALLEVTSVEREDLRLLRIEAYDEPAADRRRRLDRERKRRVRRTMERQNIRGADNRRRTASPALRALRSSSSFRLPAAQEPHPIWESISEKEKGREAPRQARPTAGRAARSAAEGLHADPSTQTNLDAIEQREELDNEQSRPSSPAGDTRRNLAGTLAFARHGLGFPGLPERQGSRGENDRIFISGR